MRARSVASYLDYYHRSRTHLSLGKDSPEPRSVQPEHMGEWWRCPRSAGCITATNDGPPETPPSLIQVWTGATPGAIPLRRKADALPFWRQEQRSPTWQPRDTLSAATLPHLFYRDRVFGRDSAGLHFRPVEGP